MDAWLSALIGSASAILGALVGATPNLLQGRAQRMERERERDAGSEAQRYERALEFIEALVEHTKSSTWGDTIRVHKAASRFVATLRVGEDGVARHVRTAVADSERGTPETRLSSADNAADEILAYLRADPNSYLLIR